MLVIGRQGEGLGGKFRGGHGFVVCSWSQASCVGGWGFGVWGLGTCLKLWFTGKRGVGFVQARAKSAMGGHTIRALNAVASKGSTEGVLLFVFVCRATVVRCGLRDETSTCACR